MKTIKIKGKCHCIVKKNGKIIKEYDMDSEQKITDYEMPNTQGRVYVEGGYRKRKYIYDRYDDWKTSVG